MVPRDKAPGLRLGAEISFAVDLRVPEPGSERLLEVECRLVQLCRPYLKPMPKLKTLLTSRAPVRHGGNPCPPLPTNLSCVKSATRCS
jgi:hypothetical protein